MPIVLVQDSPAEIHLTLESMCAAGVTRMEAVTDDDAALAYLRQEPPTAAPLGRAWCWLDLKLPRVDGRHVLTASTTDPTSAPSR